MDREGTLWWLTTVAQRPEVYDDELRDWANALADVDSELRGASALIRRYIDEPTVETLRTVVMQLAKVYGWLEAGSGGVSRKEALPEDLAHEVNDLAAKNHLVVAWVNGVLHDFTTKEAAIRLITDE